jgi:hypothetical protein
LLGINGFFTKGPVTSESSQQLQSSQQTALTGTKLGTLSPSNVAATLRTFPQSSTTPYRQQPQLVFGENRQTLGKAAVPAITLNPNFREEHDDSGLYKSYGQHGERQGLVGERHIAAGRFEVLSMEGQPTVPGQGRMRSTL